MSHLKPSQRARNEFRCAGGGHVACVYTAQTRWQKDVIQMSEDELAARRALQESLDLQDQGHTDA